LIIVRNTSRIDELKKQLSNQNSRKLYLSQGKYIKKVLQRFSMVKARPVANPLSPHFKLSIRQCPTSDEEKQEMEKVPYASIV